VAIAWPGSLQDVRRITETCFVEVDEVFLDLSVASNGALSARLGLASSQFHPSNARLGSIHSLEVLFPQHQDLLTAAMRWPGQSESESQGRVVKHTRWLDTKVVLQPDTSLQLKGYFGIELGRAGFA
jgi:hypothetical protein